MLHYSVMRYKDISRETSRTNSQVECRRSSCPRSLIASGSRPERRRERCGDRRDFASRGQFQGFGTPRTGAQEKSRQCGIVGDARCRLRASGLRQRRAAASFPEALTISPTYIPALQGAIQIEYGKGSKDAIPLLQRILRLRPSDATSHGMLAVAPDYQRGNCAAAVPHFDKVGELFDSQPAALHAYASCLVKLKQPEKAIGVVQKIVALNPEASNPDARGERRLLASIQLMVHQPNDAPATLEPLLQASEPDADTLELAATAYEANKDTPRAVSTIRQAILLDPQNVNLYLDFANLSYSHDSFQVGIDVVSDGINVQPKAAPLYFARGVLYVQLAQYDKGEADFAKAYELDPTQSLSSAAQGLAAAQQNDLDQALAKVQSSLARKPNDAIMLYLQADILSEKGAEPGSPEFQTAMRSAKQAVALQPSLATAAIDAYSRRSIFRLDKTKMPSNSAERRWRAIPRIRPRSII